MAVYQTGTLTVSSSSTDYYTYPTTWYPNQYIPWSQMKLKNEEVDTMYLYQVYLAYGGDRDNPIVIGPFNAIASNPEEAKIKSRIFSMVDSAWDLDYVTVICYSLGEIKVKPKAKEVKQV